jgi:hypothetical protein
MTIRCDHCRGPLGLIIHLRKRFCSVKCIRAYQHHLEDLTKVQIEMISSEVLSPSFGA